MFFSNVGGIWWGEGHARVRNSNLVSEGVIEGEECGKGAEQYLHCRRYQDK